MLTGVLEETWALVLFLGWLICFAMDFFQDFTSKTLGLLRGSQTPTFCRVLWVACDWITPSALPIVLGNKIAPWPPLWLLFEGEVSWHWIPDIFCLKQLSCPGRVAGGRGKPVPWALPPHLATGQGRLDPSLPPSTGDTGCWGHFLGPQLLEAAMAKLVAPLLSCLVAYHGWSSNNALLLFSTCPSESKRKGDARRTAQLTQEQEVMWSKALHQLLTCHGDGGCKNWCQTQGIHCKVI